MYLHDAIEPLPAVDSDLRERLMTIGETAALLGTSLADVVDLACQRSAPLPSAEDGRGGIGFYRSEVDCWLVDHDGVVLTRPR
jgi:hypothetical protein